MRQELSEYLNQKDSRAIIESADDFDINGQKTGKSLYLKGICIQGGIRNQNQRVYPVSEIARAVKTVNDQIRGDYSIMGQLDHPSGLEINLDRVSHEITEMWMDGPNGYGKLRILTTPMGQLVRTLIEERIKLGVSSRGSGNVKEDGSGEVSDFEIVTIDIVATPSAPGSYPTPVYEHLMNTTGGYKAILMANELQGDKRAQHYFKRQLLNIISGLSTH